MGSFIFLVALWSGGIRIDALVVQVPFDCRMGGVVPFTQLGLTRPIASVGGFLFTWDNRFAIDRSPHALIRREIYPQSPLWLRGYIFT